MESEHMISDVLSERESIVLDVPFTEEKLTLQKEETLVYLQAHGPDSAHNDEWHSYVSLFPLLTGSDNYFTFYLSKKPGINESYLKPYVERGILTLQLSYQLPSELVHHIPKATVLETTARLVATNITDKSVLYQQTLNGDSLTLNLDCDQQLCAAIHKAMSNEESGILMKSKIKCYFPSLNITKVISSSITLEKILRALTDPSSVVKEQYKYFDTGSGGYTDLPSRYFIPAHSRSLSTPALSVMGTDKVSSTTLAVSPIKLTTIPTAHLSQVSTFNNKLNLYAIDNWQINVSNTQQLHDYPVVDETTDYWVNHKNEQEYFTVPEYTIALPALNQDPKTAPFSFTFRKTGALDKNGLPVLEGTIKITVNSRIKQSVTDAFSQAHAGKTLSPVHIEQISYTLQIPYTDQEQEKTLTLSSQEIKQADGGNTEILFRLSNEAVHLAYATLSSDPETPDASKAHLSINFNFFGYTLVPLVFHPGNILGSKISTVPILKDHEAAIKPAVYFDATRNALVKDNGQEIIYKDTQGTENRQPRAIGLATPVRLHTAIAATKIQPVTNFVRPEKIDDFIRTRYRVQSFARLMDLPLQFPCTTYGNFYQEGNADETFTSVGCKETYKLGEPPSSLYSEITELHQSRYKVFRSRLSPNSFLVVPVNYIIARYPADADPDKKYKPCIFLYSAIDMVNNTSTWLLDISLVPDIMLSERTELEYQLKNYTPYTPEINYITEIPYKSAEALLSLSAMPGTKINAFPMGKSIRISVQTNIESILILLEMLKNNSMTGQFTFTLTDDTEQVIGLMPVLNQVAGTWETGHLEWKLNNNVLTVKNISEATLLLEKMRFYQTESGNNKEKTIQQNLGPDTSLDIDATAYSPYTQSVPYYSISTSATISVQEINKYIEDVKCQLVFIVTIDLNAKNIQSLEIAYRMKELDAVFSVTLDKNNTNSEAELMMPVTHFLTERVVEYKVQKITKDDHSSVTPVSDWVSQDLSTEGNIININSSIIPNN